jgi:hypothetical protein
MPTRLRRGQSQYRLRRGQKLRRRPNKATLRGIYAEGNPRRRLRQGLLAVGVLQNSCSGGKQAQNKLIFRYTYS